MDAENTRLEPGLTGGVSLIVKKEHTAKSMGSGQREVLATPALVALMEAAAEKAVEEKFDKNQQTVGVRIDLTHDKATPVGMKVNANAKLLSINGRMLTFEITAFDEKEDIASGTHIRALATVEALDRLLQKKSKK